MSIAEITIRYAGREWNNSVEILPLRGRVAAIPDDPPEGYQRVLLPRQDSLVALDVASEPHSAALIDALTQAIGHEVACTLASLSYESIKGLERE